MKASHPRTLLAPIGTWLFLASHAAAATAAVQVGPSIGSVYCNANPNSTGQPSELEAFGSRLVSDNDVTLECSQLPSNAFGYFILGLEPGFVAQPGGSFGNLCLAGSIARDFASIQFTGTSGGAARTYDLAAVPGQTQPFAAAPGDGLHFQFWHRDTDIAGLPSSNFSPGVRVRLACDEIEFGSDVYGGLPVLSLDHGDVNGDGHRDIVVTTTDSTLRVYIGDGDGSFADPIDAPLAGAVIDIALADTNADGHLDFFASTSNTVELYRGDGTGAFALASTVATEPGSGWLAAADFNGDGLADAAVPASASGISLLLVDSQGLLLPAQHFPALLSAPDSVVAADLDNDGDQDIVLSGFDGRSFETMLQDASGLFMSASLEGNLPNVEAAVADLDLDGNVDVLVGADGERIRLWEGAGDGTFSFRATLFEEDSFVVGQVTGDAIPDIVRRRADNLGLETLRGLGSFEFARIDSNTSVNSAEAVALADFTGDGRLDAVQLAPGDGGFQVSPGTPAGTFEEQALELRDYTDLVHLNVGDLNADGRDDLLWGEQTSFSSTALWVSFSQFSRSLPSPDAWMIDLGQQNLLASGVGDLDGDGTPELVLSYYGMTLEIFDVAANGLVSLGTVAVPANAIGIDFADIDEDGFPEIVASLDGPSGSLSILARGSAGDYFQARRLLFTDDVEGAVAADFNDDGHIDLAVATASGFTQIGEALVFLGNGTFNIPAPVQVATVASNSIAAADLTGDGVPELLLGTLGQFIPELVVLRFDALGLSTELDRTTLANRVRTIQTGDLGRNGHQDVVVTDFNNAQVLRGDGTGTLEEGRIYGTSGVSGAFFIDQDLDDVEDLVTLARDESIYRIRVAWGRCTD